MDKSTSFREKIDPYLYIFPALIFMAALTIFPNLYSFYISFTNYSFPYHYEEYKFVGLANYYDILTGSEIKVFLGIFIWTVIWAIGSVLSQVALGLILALILNQKKLGGVKIYRTLFIIPWAIPAFISVLMWGGILNSDGYVNTIFIAIGIGKIKWLTDPTWAKFSVLLVNLWLGFPFMMSVCLGALQSIPGDVYEAASVDGATKIQQFFKITLPLLRTAMLPVLLTSFAFNFNNFTGIYLLTQGGPPVPGGADGATAAGATDILISYTYKLAFGQANTAFYGLACAYAVVIFLMIGTLSAINFKLSGAFEEL
ncbi:MAG TPA: sugar ABC transporter permease [Candidatus Eremiobacteraeota bacterium]|nr:sugar ABC transporter permease [Candidatus Eremiobacteraeota bacterium]